MRVYVSVVCDLFHAGHVRLLKAAKQSAGPDTILVVGVCSCLSLAVAVAALLLPELLPPRVLRLPPHMVGGAHHQTDLLTAAQGEVLRGLSYIHEARPSPLSPPPSQSLPLPSSPQP